MSDQSTADIHRIEGLPISDDRTPEEMTICPKCGVERESYTPTGIFDVHQCPEGHRWTYGDDGTLKWSWYQ